MHYIENMISNHAPIPAEKAPNSMRLITVTLSQSKVLIIPSLTPESVGVPTFSAEIIPIANVKSRTV